MFLEYRSFSDLNETIIKNLYLFQKNIDLVVGIPRSGMLPANLIALYLNKPYTDLDSFVKHEIYSVGLTKNLMKKSKYRNVLVVDDSISTGKSLLNAKEKLGDLSQEINLIYAAIYARGKSCDLVDVYCKIVEFPRVFQWNIFHVKTLNKSCLDIDGVLCLDPPIDDDGPIYTEYIKNAVPLYIPTMKVDSLVTCRLEKYRKITEDWLRKNGVEYEHLIMMNFKTKSERIRYGCHGRFKGEYFKKTKNRLFIESSLKQALEINKVSKKPVFCTENFQMINSSINFHVLTSKPNRIIKKIFCFFNKK